MQARTSKGKVDAGRKGFVRAYLEKEKREPEGPLYFFMWVYKGCSMVIIMPIPTFRGSL